MDDGDKKHVEIAIFAGNPLPPAIATDAWKQD